MYGFGIYGFDVYGGAISRVRFVYLVPELIVTRTDASPTPIAIDVANPPDNGQLQIFRSNDTRGRFTLIDTVNLATLPYSDTSASSELNHKYVGRYLYTFNGLNVTVAPLSKPVYTFLKRNEA